MPEPPWNRQPELPPPFSIAERDRRWAATREAMAAEGLDVMLALASPTVRPVAQPDVRYLTQGGADGARGLSCVFPPAGEAVLVGKRATSRTSPWATARDAPTDQTAAALIDLLRPVQPRRVGVTGGFGPHTAPLELLAPLQAAFPEATWLDFAPAMQRVRARKSAEELACLRFSAALVERGLAQATAATRPGVLDQEVWAEAMAELCGAGELPTHFLWGSGARPILLAHATHAPLHRGHLILTELEANCQGYRARAQQPIAVERCDPVYHDLLEMQTAFWEGCWPEMRVGRTLREIEAAAETLAATLLPEGSRYKKLIGTVRFHGLGLGNDLPSYDGYAGSETTIPEGAVFLLQPTLRIEMGIRRYDAAWGDAVVMTNTGPERLGQRPVGLLCSDAS